MHWPSVSKARGFTLKTIPVSEKSELLPFDTLGVCALAVCVKSPWTMVWRRREESTFDTLGAYLGRRLCQKPVDEDTGTSSKMA